MEYSGTPFFIPISEISTENLRIMTDHIIHTSEVGSTLEEYAEYSRPDKIIILADTNTNIYCAEKALGRKADIIIPAGEENKTLPTLAEVWRQLSDGGASRKTLLVNIGGGVVTDLGGFAAATFKRGIRFVNIPTTLLAMVDASSGGKTAIDFNGLKNEVGTFRTAERVIVSPHFLTTLPRPQLLSGYAEMIKHGLIDSRRLWADTLLSADQLQRPSLMGEIIQRSLDVKRRITIEDPYETGLRKALNLGHTAGHALESLPATTAPHGHCIAAGLICALYLSHIKLGFPSKDLATTTSFIKEHYPRIACNCKQYPELIQIMKHDKKNHDGEIRFTLLREIGRPQTDIAINEEEIKQALDFYREG